MAATSSAHHSSIAKLRTWFHIGTVLFVIAVSVAMQVLLDRYAAARVQTYLAGFRVNAELKTRQIDLRFRLLADHVRRLSVLAERAFDSPELAHAPALQPVMQNEQIVGYGLPLPTEDDASPYGNLYAHAPITDPWQQHELDVAWALFAPIAAQHALDDALRWSGFVSFSSGNWAAYPYQRVEDFLRGSGERHLRDALLNQYQLPFFVTLKQQLANTPLLWRSPSQDQAGSGYIVSIFAPVRYRGELRSYVLADVQLAFLVSLLRADLPDSMRIEIITQQNELIADSDGSHPTAFRSTNFYAAPNTATSLPMQEMKALNWQLQDHRYRLTLPLGSVSWNTAVVVDQQHIAMLVARDIQPLRQFQVLLIGLMLALWWLLSHYFVQPSLLLADLASRQDVTSEPRMPHIWQEVKTHLRKLILEHRIALRSLQQERQQLEQQVRERTQELQNQNTELEAFNFAVSHDLRAPLRAISGFISVLQEDSAGKLDAHENAYLQRVRSSVNRMENLIEALLSLSRLSRVELQREPINLSAMAADIINELAARQPGRRVQVNIQPNLQAAADRQLLRVVLENLLGNAWKYSSKTEHAEIRFYQEAATGAALDNSVETTSDTISETTGETAREATGETVFVIADNGAGFDMNYASHLFTPFQRMHRQDEFEGTGVGLSTVQRIIHRHGGRIWAEAAIGKGARFKFTLAPFG